MTFEIKITGGTNMETVTLELPQNVTATASDIEELITILGHLRAQMNPPQSDTLPTIDPERLVTDPRWWAKKADTAESVELLIQHPGFGWLPYELPRAEAAKLGSVLSVASGVAEAAHGAVN